MNKIQTKCLAIAQRTGNKALGVKLALLAEVGKNGAGERGIFLDNAYSNVQSWVTEKEWAGHLGALQQAGFYEPSQDPEFKGRFGYIASTACPSSSGW